MRLFEHPDFEQAVLRATEHFRSQGLRPAIIEKDYFVTEALRIVAHTQPGHLTFKGGTSLSKGWHLLERFSEDLDLFLNPESYDPALGAKGVNRELKRLRDSVAAHPALTYDSAAGQTIGGFGRDDVFRYTSNFDEIPGVSTTVVVEAGK